MQPGLTFCAAALLIAVLQSGLTGCAAEPVEPPTWSQDVAPLIEGSCAGCHDGTGTAPFPLRTYEEVRAVAHAVRSAVVDRRMPPWGVDSSGDCNTFEHQRWLSDEQIDTVASWIDTDMLEGQGPALDIERQAVTIEPSVRIETPIYRPDTRLTDDYRCFVLDPKVTDAAYLTGFDVVPGEKKVVHHVLIFTVDDETAEGHARRLDDADTTPGYTCFGGSLLPPSSSRLLAGWAPGTGATRYPDGTGIRLAADRPLIVQIHYNTREGDLEDSTSVHLELRSKVERRAELLPLADLSMEVSPGRALALTEPFRIGLPGIGGFIRGVFPHMHERGRTMTARIIHPDDSVTCLTDVPRWDFDWQQFYFLDEPLYVGGLDRIELQCGYDTSGDTEPVRWGEGTEEEMCLLGLLVTLH